VAILQPGMFEMAGMASTIPALKMKNLTQVQTCLRFSGIEHTLIPSNNHASPTGALPFLLPAVSPSTSSPAPIPSTRLLRWLATQSSAPSLEASNPRAEAYTSLLDNRIRAAWLHTLYLSPPNFTIADRLYIQPSTSSPVVQTALAHQLQSAAFSELMKLSPSATQTVPSDEEIYTEAKLAFSALSTLLGHDDWFFAEERPGLFDASVFAYTCLILDRANTMKWEDKRLQVLLERCENLVGHCDRIMEKYYS